MEVGSARHSHRCGHPRELAFRFDLDTDLGTSAEPTWPTSAVAISGQFDTTGSLR